MPAETLNVPSIDPTMQAGNLDSAQAETLNIRFHTFEEAAASTKPLSDGFVEGAITNKLNVNGADVEIKGYMDSLEPTESDQKYIDDPEMTAGLYLQTAEMIQRNIKLYAPGIKASDPRAAEASRSITAFRSNAQTYAEQAADGIAAFAEGDLRAKPSGAFQMVGLLEVGGKDLLDIDENNHAEIRSNITVQRQGGGDFIMGYSDALMQQKHAGTAPSMKNRIYLNPEYAATPELFESILKTANEAGLPINLKMLQRAEDVSVASYKQSKGEPAGGLRGDGIVIYVPDAQKNEVLDMVLAIAQDNPDQFRGRMAARISTKVADGIGVGSEPDMKGESLTSHRFVLLSAAAEQVRKEFGLTEKQSLPEDKADAIKARFRQRLDKLARLNGANPDNLSFNIEREEAA